MFALRFPYVVDHLIQPHFPHYASFRFFLGRSNQHINNSRTLNTTQQFHLLACTAADHSPFQLLVPNAMPPCDDPNCFGDRVHKWPTAPGSFLDILPCERLCGYCLWEAPDAPRLRGHVTLWHWNERGIVVCEEPGEKLKRQRGEDPIGQKYSKHAKEKSSGMADHNNPPPAQPPYGTAGRNDSPLAQFYVSYDAIGHNNPSLAQHYYSPNEMYLGAGFPYTHPVVMHRHGPSVQQAVQPSIGLAYRPIYGDPRQYNLNPGDPAHPTPPYTQLVATNRYDHVQAALPRHLVANGNNYGDSRYYTVPGNLTHPTLSSRPPGSAPAVQSVETAGSAGTNPVQPNALGSPNYSGKTEPRRNQNPQTETNARHGPISSGATTHGNG